MLDTDLLAPARRALAALALLLAACGGGSGGGEEAELGELPPVVFGGGGGTLEIEVELNQPGRLSSAFEQMLDADTGESRQVGSLQALAPGEHRFEVDVAEDTYGYFEVGVPDASVGARIAWSVRLDGRELVTEETELDRPLERGYAFFVQLEFDEIAQLREYALR